MKLPPEFAQRFSPIRELGHGGQGLTWLAQDQDGTEVVLKILDFQTLASWKDLELFEREIKIQRSLNHPAIPSLVDYYAAGNGEDLILVHQFIPGDSLQDLLDADALNFDESEARRFLSEILHVLTYLHELNPPVIHRDIKPSNIVSRTDGSYALIDFGAAQSSTGLTGGTTFVGLYGSRTINGASRAEIRSI